MIHPCYSFALGADLLTTMIAAVLWSQASFVADDFVVPEGMRNAVFKLEPLTLQHAVMDFEAVKQNAAFLRDTLQWDGWPADDLTPEQNQRDIGLHMREHRARRAFTYTMLSTDGTRVLGCVYIVPAEKPGAEAWVYFWTIRELHDAGKTPLVRRALQRWLNESWPFSRVAFPGRGGSKSTQR
ncbi:MAG: GNAT family N-acetyltransferase [Acidobacteriota bacterium]|nr:GNAT family N-acetyltransferase [Acidobacteriota bacterium]